MLSYVALSLLCITVTAGLSALTDDGIQNVTSLLGEEAGGKPNTDVFRQLLNQETLIRMALVKNVHALMKDMVEIKQTMVVNDGRLRNAEKEILVLKQEVQTLKTENQHIKEQATKFQQGFTDFDKKFEETGEKFTQVANSRVEYERELDSKRREYENNTSGILDDIKTEVRYLSVTLLDLNKHTLELDKSIPNFIDDKITLFSGKLNISLENLSEDIAASSFHNEQLSKNMSTLKKSHNSLMRMISDDLNKTIHGLKEDVEQSQNNQQQLSSAVATLEIFKLNMSLNSCGKTDHVGFTVGMTSRHTTWAGSTLVFPHVVFNNGNGYNPSTGIFTSPTDGTYVFFVNVNVYGANYIYLDIVLNGSSKVRTMSHNTAQYMTGTNMAVLQLVKGDSVWVKLHDGKSYYSHSVPITTFSGFLL
ncbi:uncharacterized protein LOC133191049 [Saccostrea echinata]|uniref:uncharacterized protein LOC133191049 n=1 Tax=Saccostrea echinata TaxID=191078 RepID=UPI002A80EC8B|nr:uncharacterized protein LOC133191049 [Saccostrea echinata]